MSPKNLNCGNPKPDTRKVSGQNIYQLEFDTHLPLLDISTMNLKKRCCV